MGSEKEKILDFLVEANKLKDVKRTGWVRAKVRYPESVAAHVFSMALMASLLAKKLEVDKEKLMDMILIHELSEIHVGDIATILGEKTGFKRGFMHTVDKKGKIVEFRGNKAELEEKSMRKILSKLPRSLKKRYYSLWREFEKNETREAKIAHDLDRLDHSILALLYKKRTKMKLDDFVDVEDRLKTASVKNIHKIIRKRFYS